LFLDKIFDGSNLGSGNLDNDDARLVGVTRKVPRRISLASRTDAKQGPTSFAPASGNMIEQPVPVCRGCVSD